MSIEVETAYRHDPVLFPAADDCATDDKGNLIILTGRTKTPIAMIAAGRWLCARHVPNRGPDGRFVKRGG